MYHSEYQRRIFRTRRLSEIDFEELPQNRVQELTRHQYPDVETCGAWATRVRTDPERQHLVRGRISEETLRLWCHNPRWQALEMHPRTRSYFAALLCPVPEDDPANTDALDWGDMLKSILDDSALEFNVGWVSATTGLPVNVIRESGIMPPGWKLATKRELFSNLVSYARTLPGAKAA